MGGWMLAIGGMRGNLAELTRSLSCVPAAVPTPTVVFPIGARPAPAEEGRGNTPRTVRVS